MGCKPIAAVGRSIDVEQQSVSVTANIAAGNALGSQLSYENVVSTKDCTSQLLLAELVVNATTTWTPTNMRVLLLQNNSESVAANDTVDVSTLYSDYQGTLNFASGDFDTLDGSNYYYQAYTSVPSGLSLEGDGASSTIKAIILDLGGTDYSANNATVYLRLTVSHD